MLFRSRSAKGYEKSPEAHYQTMAIEDIAALPVDQLAGPDCYLFMWSTWPHLPDALWVMQQWGFDYISGGSWTKRTRNWNINMGTGYVLRSATEPFLVGKLGRPRPGSRSVRNLILAAEDIADVGETALPQHAGRHPSRLERGVVRKCGAAAGRVREAGHDHRRDQVRLRAECGRRAPQPGRRP